MISLIGRRGFMTQNPLLGPLGCLHFIMVMRQIIQRNVLWLFARLLEKFWTSFLKKIQRPSLLLDTY